MLATVSPFSYEALIEHESEIFVYDSSSEALSKISITEKGIWLNQHGLTKNIIINDIKNHKKIIKLYIECRTSLRMVLYSLDKDIDPSGREKSIKIANQYLKNESIKNWIIDAFCINEIPENSLKTLLTSLSYAENNDLGNYLNVFSFIKKQQKNIIYLSNFLGVIEERSLLKENHQSFLDRSLGSLFFKRIIDTEILFSIAEVMFLIGVESKNIINPQFFTSYIPKEFDFLRFIQIVKFEDIMHLIMSQERKPRLNLPKECIIIAANKDANTFSWSQFKAHYRENLQVLFYENTTAVRLPASCVLHSKPATPEAIEPFIAYSASTPEDKDIALAAIEVNSWLEQKNSSGVCKEMEWDYVCE